jgi:hypothetical protein
VSDVLADQAGSARASAQEQRGHAGLWGGSRAGAFKVMGTEGGETEVDFIRFTQIWGMARSCTCSTTVHLVPGLALRASALPPWGARQQWRVAGG